MEDDFSDLSGMFPTLEGYAVLTEGQIKYMSGRFLSWRLPKTFNPDNGIRFDRAVPHPSCPPVGTNLLSADEAERMVRYMAEGMPEK